MNKNTLKEICQDKNGQLSSKRIFGGIAFIAGTVCQIGVIVAAVIGTFSGIYLDFDSAQEGIMFLLVAGGGVVISGVAEKKDK